MRWNVLPAPEMKTNAPSPLTLLNTCLLLLLIWLTLGNRKVGQGNAARLDSQRVIYELEASFQRRQSARLMKAAADRWNHLYDDNPQLQRRRVSVADMQEPLPPELVDIPVKDK